MGRAYHLLFCVFLFFLIVSFAGREIPENVRLIDDPSNDGQEAVARIDSLAPPDLRRLDARDDSTPFVSSNSHFRNEEQKPRNRQSQRHPSIAFAIRGQNLLYFLSMQRT